MSNKKFKCEKKAKSVPSLLEQDLSPEFYEAVSGLDYLDPEYMREAKKRSREKKNKDA